VFYRLHERPPEERCKLGSWLYRVATNVGLNALRARQRRRRYEEEAVAFKLQHATPVDPAAEVERREARQCVRQVLAQMKPRAAQILVLRHSGLSYADIAATLNVAPGSVGTLLTRAEKEFERRYRALEGKR
jgi:RNA polymerase sigma-70 factor (ECF subfamily)